MPETKDEFFDRMERENPDASQAQYEAWWQGKQRMDNDAGISGTVNAPEVPLSALGDDVPGVRLEPEVGEPAAVTRRCRDCGEEQTFTLPNQETNLQRWARQHNHDEAPEQGQGQGGGN